MTPNTEAAVASHARSADSSQAVSIAGLPQVGQPWPSQGGIFMGLITNEESNLTCALILATAAAGMLRGTWGPRSAVQGAKSEYDGFANTLAMAAAGSAIAKTALAAEIDGHRDYYIPARREARLLFVNSPQQLSNEPIWTSSQSRGWDVSAWVQWFDGGSQHDNRKDDVLPVRLVRRLVIR